MNKVCLCFGIEPESADMSLLNNLEKDYQEVYKPAATFLYSHPGRTFFFMLNGPQLSFFHKRHPEFLEIVSQLINRKQLEIIGGGYYNPVLPLLFPMDRNGQIELLSSEIRRLTGKRPRGMTVCAGIWDSSLVTNLQTCGIEYALLDSSLIPPEKQCFQPLIMSDKGKSVDILTVYRSLKPDPAVSSEIYINDIRKRVGKISGLKVQTEWNSAVVTFAHSEFSTLLSSGWFESFFTAAESGDESIRVVTPSVCRKVSPRIPAYIASGMNDDIAQWAATPYTAVPLNKRYPLTIYDFLQSYPQSKALYDRMLYVSMLVNQCHGDKMRKSAAREKLWESQSGEGFICTSSGAFANSSYRQSAYRSLTEAEKLLRSCGKKFEESVIAFDYNGDGNNEYLCRMMNYTSCISLTGGSIRELDVMQNSGNYADNLSRIKEFDSCEDNYTRGMFVDHIFTDDDFVKYLNNEPAGDGIFSRSEYEEIHFSPAHQEIQLATAADFSEKKQRLSLRKKYIANSNGCTVQYILKNESPEKISAKFIVESNFSQTNFAVDTFNAYKVEIVSAGERKEIDTKKSVRELSSSGLLKDVSAVQISDIDNGISFIFEPNENCGFTFAPITFMRPAYTTAEVVPAGMTFSTAMFWDLTLDAGHEIEKTVNFCILTVRRSSVKNSRKSTAK